MKVKLGEYMSFEKTLDDELSQFVGEVNDVVTRHKIIFTLDKWNLQHGTNITIDDLNIK